MRFAIVASLVCAGCFDWESLSPETVCSGVARAPGMAADYVIHLLPADAVIMDSNTCSEPFWDSVPVIKLEPDNPTNNCLRCRIVWEPGMAEAEDVIHGCCEATDADLQAVYEPTAPDQLVYEDDAFEYYLTQRPNTLDDTTTKVAINITASVWDADFDNDMPFDASYDAGVVARVNTAGQTINDAATLDTGYTIKWRANVGFTVSAPHVAGCGFLMSDNDAGMGRMLWNAYGTGRDDINDPTKWGQCVFLRTPPPGQ